MWQKQQKSGLTELSTLVEKYQKGDISLTTVKTTVVKYLADSVKTTDKVIQRLRRVGAPAVKNGNTLQQDELKLLGHAKRTFQNAKKTTQALSTSNVTTFGQGLAAVGKKLTAVSQNISAAEARLHRYSSKALTDAARHEPACSQVGAFLP
jgi:hypothetical protein